MDRLLSSSLELSILLSYILLDTYSFLGALLEECGTLGILEQEGKGRVGKCKRTSGSTTTMGFSCRYRVACIISSLVLACMTHACGFLLMICHWHGGLIGLTMVLPRFSILWIAIVMWVSFHLFSGWSSCSFGCGLSY